MAVRIRMKRMGRTHRPFYRICVMDQKVQRDGKAIEEVGTYDPMVREKSKRVTVDLERVDYWISVGAQPTEKVAVLYCGKYVKITGERSKNRLQWKRRNNLSPNQNRLQNQRQRRKATDTAEAESRGGGIRGSTCRGNTG